MHTQVQSREHERKLCSAGTFIFTPVRRHADVQRPVEEACGRREDHIGSKRHSLQVVELSQQTRTAVQIVSNPPAPSNGGPIYRFLGMPAMRTRWMAGAAAHKSG